MHPCYWKSILLQKHLKNKIRLSEKQSLWCFWSAGLIMEIRGVYDPSIPLSVCGGLRVFAIQSESTVSSQTQHKAEKLIRLHLADEQTNE